MSTGQPCEIINVKSTGRSYLILGRPGADIFDWLSDAECFGPFGSQRAAEFYLADHFANPGMIVIENVENPDERLASVIRRASK